MFIPNFSDHDLVIEKNYPPIINLKGDFLGVARRVGHPVCPIDAVNTPR